MIVETRFGLPHGLTIVSDVEMDGVGAPVSWRGRTVGRVLKTRGDIAVVDISDAAFVDAILGAVLGNNSFNVVSPEQGTEPP